VKHRDAKHLAAVIVFVLVMSVLPQWLDDRTAAGVIVLLTGFVAYAIGGNQGEQKGFSQGRDVGFDLGREAEQRQTPP
jgi:hypothetical protein